MQGGGITAGVNTPPRRRRASESEAHQQQQQKLSLTTSSTTTTTTTTRGSGGRRRGSFKDYIIKTHSDASFRALQAAAKNSNRNMEKKKKNSATSAYEEKDIKRLEYLRQASQRTSRTQLLRNGDSATTIEYAHNNHNNDVSNNSNTYCTNTNSSSYYYADYCGGGYHNNNAQKQKQHQQIIATTKRNNGKLAEIESCCSGSGNGDHENDAGDGDLLSVQSSQQATRASIISREFIFGSSSSSSARCGGGSNTAEHVRKDYDGNINSNNNNNNNNDPNNNNNNNNINNTNKKKKLFPRESMCDPHAWLMRLTSFRDLCGAIVNHPKVQFLIILLIIINAIMMGIGTFDFVTDNPSVNRAFEVTDKAFLFVFTVEIAMQALYHGFAILADGWLLFDLIIVSLSWSFESLQIIRSFRVFRAFRLVTRIKPLRNLILALFAVAPHMTAILALLCLILYIYAVMCTALFKDLYSLGVTDDNYFGRLDVTLFTLFQMMTLEWVEIARQVMDKYWWAWVIFSTFLVITSFILYSLIIAVVCDSVKVEEHKEEMADHVRLKDESRRRIFALEKQVGDMKQQQLIILESLQSALRQLQEQPASNSCSDDFDESTCGIEGDRSSVPTPVLPPEEWEMAPPDELPNVVEYSTSSHVAGTASDYINTNHAVIATASSEYFVGEEEGSDDDDD